MRREVMSEGTTAPFPPDGVSALTEAIRAIKRAVAAFQPWLDAHPGGAQKVLVARLLTICARAAEIAEQALVARPPDPVPDQTEEESV